MSTDIEVPYFGGYYLAMHRGPRDHKLFVVEGSEDSKSVFFHLLTRDNIWRRKEFDLHPFGRINASIMDNQRDILYILSNNGTKVYLSIGDITTQKYSHFEKVLYDIYKMGGK